MGDGRGELRLSSQGWFRFSVTIIVLKLILRIAGRALEKSVRGAASRRRHHWPAAKAKGGERASIPIFEMDETGLIKINALANWSFKETKAYIDANGVPYNALLDQGYTSIGDWHSTKKPDGSKLKGLDGDAAERSGRWAGRAEKTECGLHKDYFKMRAAFNKKRREREQRERDEARGDLIPVQVA